MSRRRRALLLGGLALVLGGLAAFNVAGREAALERKVGGLVDVVVARRSITAGTRIPARALAIRRVPERFAPRGTTGDPRAVAGQRAAVAIAAGTDLTAGMVGGERPRAVGPAVGRGERVAEVVALGSPQLVTAGSRVDVLVTPEPASDGAAEAVLTLEDVEVLAAAPTGADDAPGGQGRAGTARVGLAAGHRAPGRLPRRRSGLRTRAAVAAARARRPQPRSRRAADGARAAVAAPSRLAGSRPAHRPADSGVRVGKRSERRARAFRSDAGTLWRKFASRWVSS
ncbi:MAG TPA: SAF domain-containing protein [Solirubrobacteraceae bacterium]|nr:SAF domain-containing protein [Solirubrobacteraceae bacterium]